jgi:PleD family two-component response regulator
VTEGVVHAAGDELLRLVAHRLSDCVRAEETVARLGGDEFTVLMEDIEDPSNTVAVAERILRAFATPFEVRDRRFAVTATIGMATSFGDHPAADELLRQADQAMYLAKHKGGSRWERFDDRTQPQLLDLASVERGAIRVLVADDNADLRSLIKVKLQLEGPVEVVGEAADGAEAVALAKRLTPDAIVLDLVMPTMTGLEAIPHLRAGCPGTKIVILTGYDDQGLSDEALAAGADAYLTKDITGPELCSVLDGLCSSIAARPLQPTAR